MYKKRKFHFFNPTTPLFFMLFVCLMIGILAGWLLLGHQTILLAQEISSHQPANQPDHHSANQMPPWNMHFWAAPGTDGTSLFVSSGQTAQLSGDLSANGIGPTGKYGVGMSYDDDKSAYTGLISGLFLPGSSIAQGQVGLSAELDGETFDTGLYSFRRFFVPMRRDPSGLSDERVLNMDVLSDDNLLQMTINNNSLDVDAYMGVMATSGLPGALPDGYQLVSRPYSVRPSGGDFTSNSPLLLKLFYNNTMLGDLDAHTLSIVEWDSAANQWTDLGGTLDNLIENSLNTISERFTVYALVSAPRWLDKLTNFSGLNTFENTTILLPNGDLVLNGLSLTGTAVSHPIMPSGAIEEWGTLSFTREVPNGTTLTIDLLDANDNVLLSDVSSGTSLASFDPTTYASLKLRANFSTNDQNNSASLGEWSINWQASNSETPILTPTATPQAPTATATSQAPTATATSQAPTATATSQAPTATATSQAPTATPTSQAPTPETPTITPTTTATSQAPIGSWQIYLPLLLTE